MEVYTQAAALYVAMVKHGYTSEAAEFAEWFLETFDLRPGDLTMPKPLDLPAILALMVKIVKDIEELVALLKKVPNA